MKNNINFSNNEIIFIFNKVNKKYNIELIYMFVNEYQLLNNSMTPSFPSMTIKEIEINTKILNDWINLK